MVLEKLTLFEIHMDSPQFGPASLGDGEAREDAATTSADTAPEADDRSAGPSAGKVLLAVGLSVALSVAAALVARRLFGGEEQTTIEEYTDVEVDAEDLPA